MSRLWFGAASVTGGKIKTLAQKRPIATAREAASRVSLFLVIIPSYPESDQGAALLR
jgi:hypothetical protein